MQITAARPVKDETWQKLKATQETERNDLKQRHTQEIGELSRQHMAERHALHERWRDRHLEKQAQRTSARLEARQGMVPVQMAAMTMIRQRAEADRHHAVGASGPQPLSPLAASQQFSERARTAAAARDTIRSELNATRQLNQIPGVVSHCVSLVGHPDLVAQRIARFAGVVGRERVIASSDCGFASSGAGDEVHPLVAWAKLEALVEGARRASGRLW